MADMARPASDSVMISTRINADPFRACANPRGFREEDMGVLYGLVTDVAGTTEEYPGEQSTATTP
jgi:hypothetical protein